MESYDTLTEAISGLREQGYTIDFNLNEEALVCDERNLKLFHDEFKVDKFFRFEGDSDPGDEVILYAISSPNHNLKGVLINAFGMYSDTNTNIIISNLPR